MMKLIHSLVLPAALLLTVSLNAQDQNRPRPGGPGGPGAPGGPGGERRPPPPLVAALDLDKDGEISAEEIAKASESLKALDKNGDGKLTHEELRPPGGPGGGGPGGGGPGGGGKGGPGDEHRPRGKGPAN